MVGSSNLTPIGRQVQAGGEFMWYNKMTDLEREILEAILQLSPEQIKIALLSSALSAVANEALKQRGPSND